jgi:hypothetical protein
MDNYNSKKLMVLAVATSLLGIIPSLHADQVISDDLIVNGSTCVGFDCVNGESFGFDTIRLKENNLRIKFQDTSASASFPTNDWQITANDTSNGGANKFSIDDVDGGRTPFTIEAGAPSHSLYVDDGGRLGLGTSTPVVEVHMKDGDTPTLRLEQDGSSGFAPQTWDVAGNETNFFIRDVTNGSTLPFRIQPGAPSSSIYIANTGNIGLGTTSPSAQLHILDNSTGYPNVLLVENSNTSSNFVGLRMKTNHSTDATTIDFNNAGQEWRLNFDDGDGNELSLDTNGNLSVTGTITANGSTFPDYVFAPNYDLMPLNQLSEYITTNNRLPNIPSAEDILLKGLNMTEMQKKLMEKIEELTLYTISQQKEIDNLREHISKISK